MEYTMGIDLGTSSVKVVLLNRSGKMTEAVSKRYRIDIPVLGWAEQDPEEWWTAARAAVQEVLCTYGAAGSQVKAIGFSGQMHGLVALGKDGRPVCPAIIWMDQRAGQESAEIQKIAEENGLTQKLMNRPIPGALICSLLWLKRHRPAQFEKIRWVMPPKDYLRYRMCGEAFTDETDASAALAFSVADRRWCGELLEKLDMDPSLFPPIVRPYEICGKVTPYAAREMGLEPGTPLAAGGADSAMQLVGNGIVAPGTAACNIGTGAQVLAAADCPAYDAQLRSQTFCHAAENTWYLQCGTLNGGSALSWLKNQALENHAGFDVFLQTAEDTPAGAEGLLFLPYLAGERNPHLDPDAKGVFCGLSMKHRQGHLIRAVMEGVAYNLRECMDILQSQGLSMNRLIASGGGAKGHLWRQILADMFDTPVYTTKTVEEACTGAAIMAAVGIGWYENTADAVEKIVKMENEVTLPVAAHRLVYEENRQHFRQLYESTRNLL